METQKIRKLNENRSEYEKSVKNELVEVQNCVLVNSKFIVYFRGIFLFDLRVLVSEFSKLFSIVFKW